MWTNRSIEKGLKLFEEITYLDEYYLTNAEIEALAQHADAIAEHIPSGSRLIELGSGYVRLSLTSLLDWDHLKLIELSHEIDH